jgi:hypothetical protein
MVPEAALASGNPEGRIAMSEANEREPQHQYPSAYQPGSHWAVDAGWEILDILKPGVIPDEVRFWLAGAIAGRLMRERDAAQAALDSRSALT